MEKGGEVFDELVYSCYDTRCTSDEGTGLYQNISKTNFRISSQVHVMSEINITVKGGLS